jgi:hypothetical protein
VSAYVFALCASGQLDKKELSEQQLALVEGLDQQDPTYLLALQEEEILEKLAALFEDGLPALLKDRKGALFQATSGYLESLVYTSVVTLLKAQPELAMYGSKPVSP